MQEQLLAYYLQVGKFFKSQPINGFISAILYPIDLVKVRYQVYDKSGRAYRSLASAFTTIFKQEGLSGLYQVCL